MMMKPPVRTRSPLSRSWCRGPSRTSPAGRTLRPGCAARRSPGAGGSIWHHPADAALKRGAIRYGPPEFFAGRIRLDEYVDPRDAFEEGAPCIIPVPGTWHRNAGFAVVPQRMGIALAFDHEHVPGFPGLLEPVAAVESALASLLLRYSPHPGIGVGLSQACPVAAAFGQLLAGFVSVRDSHRRYFFPSCRTPAGIVF